MTGYEQFVTTGEPNSEYILWELEIDRKDIPDMLEFLRSFVISQGYEFRIGKVINTTTSIFTKNNKAYRFAGCVNEGNKWAFKIKRTFENE